MGYDSTFSGSLRPSKPLTEEIIKIIKEADLDLCVAEPCDDSDGEPGDIVPASRCMHGYDLPLEVFKLQRMLDKHGIKLTGEIERVGEDANGDYEKTEAIKGKIYVRTGEITYGKRRQITLENITNYAVKVYCRSLKGKKDVKFVGWLGTAFVKTGQKYTIIKDQERPIPPINAARFSTREDAEKVAKKFKLHGHKCEVLQWESEL